MYTNKQKIPLPVALFLATDNYDHSSNPNEISVTTLIKSVRQIILSDRASIGDGGAVKDGDICDLVPSRLGTAIHEGIEKAWMSPAKGLKALGFSEQMIEDVIVNPADGTDLEGKVAVYLERRTKREIYGRVISGSFDFCGDGTLGDFKNTGTFMYTKKKSDTKYILQGSIYRWLNSEIITDNTLHIYFIFKDWSAAKALGSDKYPQSSVHDYELEMMSYEDTERYIQSKLAELAKYKESPQEELPNCSDEDLWMEESEYKYYGKEDAKRATKNFGTDAAAAYHHKALKGKGVVREIKAEPKACRWCSAAKCSQRDGYVSSGNLKV